MRRNVWTALLVAGLLLALVGSVAAVSDADAGLTFHPFTMDAGNDTCVPWTEDGASTRNCDPVNLLFAGQSLAAVQAALEAHGWTTTSVGTIQALHFATADLYDQDLQLAYQESWTRRYHLRLWVDPGAAGVVGAVHHEQGFFTHTIDLSWEASEAFVAGQLCPDEFVCAAGDLLVQQVSIQDGEGDAGAWRGWANDGSATVFSRAAANSAPVVTIDAPADGAGFVAGETISFSATASDDEDGDLSASLSWTSDLDGYLGSGPTLELATLSAGTHLISAAVSDAGGLSGSDAITITVSEAPPPAAEALAVDVWTDKPGYNNRETVLITVAVADGQGGAVAGADIIVTVDTPAGRTWSKTAASDAAGTATVSYKVNQKRDGQGTYAVTATATAAGFEPGSAATTFTSPP